METVEYLSDEWIRLADERLAPLTPVRGSVAVGMRVMAGPNGDRIYHLHLGPDRVGVGQGDDGCGVHMILNWDIAVAIAQGNQSAQRAFLDGEVQLGGDTSVLLGHQQQLAEIDDRLSELRAITNYDS